MKISKSLDCVLLALVVFALLGCNDLGSGTLLLGGGSGDDDDTASGDDDTASGDDDTASGDDDTASGDDDTASGDDDTASGDDDDTAPGDDDTVPGDDDDGPDGPHQLTGDYEGDFLMFVDLPGGGQNLEEACEGEVELEIEPDGRYEAWAECEWMVWGGPDYEFQLEGTVTTSLQFNGEVYGSNSWNQEVGQSTSIGYIKDGYIKLQWDGVTPGQGQLSRPYEGVAWMEVD
jgi:hypothetical protein